jgi:hypothetical protein
VNAKKVGLAGVVVAFLASPAGAQTLTVEKARAIVTPFYEALNRPAEKDVAKLLEQALRRTGCHAEATTPAFREKKSLRDLRAAALFCRT